MSKLPQLKEKARNLEAKDPRGAIETWVQVLKAEEEEGVPNPDLSIYNRIGDLYLKVKDPAQAADYYDRAVDKYAELGFHNNAIAMCNKVLRNAPARQTTYLKLAKLYAAKGFMAEAKQNFVEYAERMQKIGKIQQAFAALKEVTDISPESEHLREMLEEHLKMYGAVAQRRTTAGRVGPSAAAPAAPSSPSTTATGKRKTSSLVFLDLNEPPAPKSKPGMRAPEAPAAPPPSPPGPPEVAAETLVEEVTAEPDSSLEIEATNLAEDLGAGGVAGGHALDGLEATHTDFDRVQASADSAPSLREEAPVEEIEPMADLEPTAEEVEEAAPPPPPPPPPAPRPPRVVIPKAPTARPAPRPPELPRVKPVVPTRPAAPRPAATPPPSPPKPPAPAELVPPDKRKTVVEVPPLELEPDFETATADAGHEVDDEPLATEEAHPMEWIETEDDTSVSLSRKSGFIDLGVDEVVSQGDQGSSLVFANIEAAPSGPSIEELEGRVADNPDDPEAHQALGEALIEVGERERGLEELDLATQGFENVDNLQQAQALLDEILRLDPNSVRHRQKQVEFAFREGNKAKLIDAYVELADTLLRNDLPDKARAVYERVVERDPENERAKAALAMLAPVAEPVPEPTERRVAAKDAKMTVRDETATDGDFVDLGAMILEEETSARDTRMKVEDEEPTGDEEQDFQDMLARFRQGIEENIDEADFQSHYDLGVAFKEMGLLDEAIAELQKALRAPEGKLRTSEALGVCFFEKGAYVVTESILRRGLDLPASSDQERLGILYWLARALEEQGKKGEARELYGRVFAVDIRFRDVAERVKALAKAK